MGYLTKCVLSVICEFPVCFGLYTQRTGSRFSHKEFGITLGSRGRRCPFCSANTFDFLSVSNL